MLFRIDKYKSETGTATIETHENGKFILKVYNKQGNLCVNEKQPSHTLAKMAMEKYLGYSCTRVKCNLIIDEINNK